MTGNIEQETSSSEFYPSPEVWTTDGDAVHLIGSRCPKCGKHAFPSSTFCDQCGERTGQEPVKLSTKGILYSFSEIYVAPKAFRTPYVVGYIDLPEGVRVFGQVEHEASELRIDEEVQVVLGVIRNSESGRPVISYKFRKKGETAHA